MNAIYLHFCLANVIRVVCFNAGCIFSSILMIYYIIYNIGKILFNLIRNVADKDATADNQPRKCFYWPHCFILTVKAAGNCQHKLEISPPSCASFFSPHHRVDIFVFSTLRRQSVLRPKVTLSYQPLRAAARTQSLNNREPEVRHTLFCLPLLCKHCFSTI